MKPRSAAPVLGVLLVLPLALASSGCWYDVKSHCPGCTVVDHAATTVPVPAPGTHTEVVMVHGTWGFGSEWTKVVAAVRQYPGFDLMVWSWPGAFRDVRLDAQAFGVELQALVDFLPASVDEVIVLAHSAGAVMTNFSMRQLRVPPGRHVTVALLDPPPFPPIVPRDEYLPLPPRVTATLFHAKGPPPKQQPILVPSAGDGTDLPQEYVGPVGHDPIVAMVSLPILAARHRARPSAVAESPAKL
ncbi:MAG: esterase/lipase family protein [Polyangiaceae bacterium]